MSQRSNFPLQSIGNSEEFRQSLKRQYPFHENHGESINQSGLFMKRYLNERQAIERDPPKMMEIQKKTLQKLFAGSRSLNIPLTMNTFTMGNLKNNTNNEDKKCFNCFKKTQLIEKCIFCDKDMCNDCNSNCPNCQQLSCNPCKYWDNDRSEFICRNCYVLMH